MFDPGSPEQQLEQKLAGIVRDLDELCGMAINPETIDLIQTQKPLIGTLLRRSGTLVNLMLARHPQSFRKHYAA